MDVESIIADEEDEYPIIFLDNLPKNFQSNKDLCALASLIPDEPKHGPHQTKKKEKVYRKQRHPVKTSTGKSANVTAKELERTRFKEARNKRVGKAKVEEKNITEINTAELQLFMNLWNI
mmetsp:Transcript_26323/g.34008  ORF Transcript_26323/g.34008 Transcript_26323/m.34008 type:complete len:120 (-) Transcript_26323:119-478(-)